jgi:molybdopterin adenylyltransferase
MSSPSRQHELAARQQHGQVRCAIITVSDTRTDTTDTSGQAIRELLGKEHHVVSYYDILKDEPAQIVTAVKELAPRPDVDAILLNGGTGIGKRDSTVEAIGTLLDKTLVGFGELFRMLSYQEIGAAAMLSRAVGGVYHGKLVFSMPGSTHAVTLAMEKLILPELAHLVWELRK